MWLGYRAGMGVFGALCMKAADGGPLELGPAGVCGRRTGLVLLFWSWCCYRDPGRGLGLLVIQHDPVGLGPTSVISTPLPEPHTSGRSSHFPRTLIYGGQTRAFPFPLATYLKSTVDFPCPYSICTGLSPNGGGATEWHHLMLIV